jgi:D-threo-aldose 1-dehydrogenase
VNVDLPGGLTVSRLGFGCSGLMARLTRRESLLLLETAFANGITHFDTARLYGYGEAESVLGEFIGSRRGKVTITSKAGILPPERTILRSAIRPLARRLVTSFPKLGSYLRHAANTRVQRARFDVPSVRESLKTSLRELRTDSLDVFLLHDCEFVDTDNPALNDFLERLKASGVIRHYGIAAAFDVVRKTYSERPSFAKVVQFSNKPWQDAYDLKQLPNAATFTHSALGVTFKQIYRILRQDDGLACAWSRRLDFDARDERKLAHAFLAAALEANPKGCVIFSSQRAASVASNAAVTSSPIMLAALRHLISASTFVNSSC